MKTFISVFLLSSSILFLSPSLFSQLSINEILADNSNSISDESGDFEDWIEIYNGTNQAVDIGGYFLSDDPMDPLLWQIPTNVPGLTTIPAGGYLILWADKDISDGPLHVNLKLSAGGENLSLYSSDGTTVVDHFIFGPQNEDISFGRSADGGTDFQIFTSPTPGLSNETVSPTPTFTTIINSEIQFAEDDAIEYGVSNQAMELTSWGMKMTQSWSNQKIGIRFRDLQIPQGATITNANIQFTARKVTDDYCELIIHGQKTGNANHFADVDRNISDRTLTQSEVVWEPEAWEVQDFKGPDEKTPNLAALIQEIVDQSSWEQGNAMAFIINGTGVRSAHNYTSGFAPTISIEMEVPIPTDPITGLYINEVAANGTDFPADNGKFTDWIEIYNDNDFDVSIGGLYLSDKVDDLSKWQITSNEVIPAKGHLLFFADENTAAGGRHANFKLSNDGETLSLSQVLNNELVVIDSISYGVIPFKSSAGRSTDGANDWVLFGLSTPEDANDASIEWLAPPTIDLDNGVFSNTQSVTISHLDVNVDIYYTTDGTLPDENQELYTGPISVSSTQSLRAIATKSGHTASQVTTRSYLFDASPDLPVLMITTDPGNLFDDEIGIYTVGTNGIEVGFCSQGMPANFWQDWERPANLTFFEPDGDAAFSVDAGMKISGNCSRRYALKSLNFYLRNNQYGSNNIDYKLFPNRDFKKYDRLRLRSSGQDYRATMLRDGTNQRMLAEVTEVEYQNYRPTLVYINGEYWGIQNFRDLYGGEYFDAHFDVKEDELDLIKSPNLSHDIKEGDDIHFQNLYSYISSNDLSIPANYDYFQTQFDIQSFLDYWVSMIYMASSDWPANNLQIWRERKSNGKWRYMYLDTDATTNLYSFNSTNGYTWNTLGEVTSPNQVGWPFDQKATLFFRKLLMNEDFKNEYIQRSCSFMELILSEERAHEFIDASVAEIDSEIGRHVEKYAYDNPYLVDYEDWYNKIIRYKTFFEERPAYYYDQMESYFDLDDRYNLSFNYDASTNGEIFLHSKEMEIPFGYIGSYYENIPIRITAKAADGYEFIEWLETGDTDATIFFTETSDFTLTPIFQALNDVCDPSSPNFEDDDNDGICNADDLCPGFDDNVDLNNNGIPDGCEPCDDDDNDGICNAEDLCPGFDDNVDLNNNGIPDGCEPCEDDDNDGVCNADDLCPGFDDNVDLNNNGIPDGCEPCEDDDNDGVCNEDDQCPGFDDNVDANNNGIPDGCEPCDDDDNDGICNADDLCPGFDDNIDLNNNGIPDDCEPCDDDDNDGVCNDDDQCPGFDDNIDLNNNGIPDGCEPCEDDDNDGVCNADDLCPGFDDNIDLNNNGIPDGCEPCEDDDNDGVCNDDDQCPGFDDNIDVNNNGIPDGCEPCEDDDNDGICNDDDQCPGFDDNIDLNNNGIPDGCEPQCADDDNDGVCNDDDLCPGFDDNVDLNNNGIPDGCEQGCTDVDDDGVCEMDDCDDNDPDVPAIAGSSCDDGNPNTSNDVYLVDGCTCEGMLIPSLEYCENEGDFPWHEWIAGVQLNEIDNTSRKKPYTDFTDIETSLEIGATYDITLTTEYSWETFDEYFRVWIDYNSDNNFTADEIAFSGIVSAPPNGTEFASISGSLTVPSNLTDGESTRMRVAMQRGSYPEPCVLIPFGEVEDYTVTFHAPAILDRIPLDVQIPVWPVPARDIVKIKMPADVNVNTISVLNSQGKEKMTFTTLPAAGEIFSLDVIDWEEGLYFIQMNVVNGKRRFAKVIVAGK